MSHIAVQNVHVVTVLHHLQECAHNMSRIALSIVPLGGELLKKLTTCACMSGVLGCRRDWGDGGRGCVDRRGSRMFLGLAAAT